MAQKITSVLHFGIRLHIWHIQSDTDTDRHLQSNRDMKPVAPIQTLGLTY
jgi:hypothetical protein